MKKQIIFKKITTDDELNCFEKDNEIDDYCYLFNYIMNGFVECKEDESYIIGAYKENKLVGLIDIDYADTDGLEGYIINNIIVEPNSRKDRIGTMLINEAINKLILPDLELDNEITGESLKTKLYADSIDEAIGFYENLGFSRLKKKGFRAMMCKSLKFE